MGKNNIVKKIFLFIVGLSIVLFLLVQSINNATYDLEFYRNYAQKNKISEEVGVEHKQVILMYKSMQDQIKTGDNDYLKPFFNEKEIAHMEDVHNLYSFANTVKYISLSFIILFLLYFIFSRNKISKVDNIIIVRNSILIFIFLIFILAIFISIDFSSAFVKFHKIFFDNDLWLLDPKTDLMIRMLPEKYFLNISIRIFLSFISGVILSIVLLSFIIKFLRRDKCLNTQEVE